MAAHPSLEVLDGITNFWDLEEYIFDTIGPAVREAGAYTIPQFLTVAYWKSRRQLANYRKNETRERTVGGITAKALVADVPNTAKPGVLWELAGVRIPVASALLTVWHPDEFTIIDTRALKALACLGEGIEGVGFNEHGQRWWEEEHYDMYMRACQEIAGRVKPFSLRDVDRALWKWAQLNALG